jgi:hypothetical protein
MDPGINWSLYHSAISSRKLVESAIPDQHEGKPEIFIPDGVIYGGVLSKSGYKSKYETNFREPFTINYLDEKWTTLSHLRIGRTIKSMRKAYGESLFPISLDAVNEKIISSLLMQHDTFIEVQKEPFLDFSIDIVDPIELESELENLNWSEVYKLRKHLLPKTSEFRHFLIRRLKTLQNFPIKDLEAYKNELNSLNSDFLLKKEALMEEWEKLRIASLIKTGKFVACTTMANEPLKSIGLQLFPAGLSWLDLLVKILASGLIISGSLSTELKTLIPAYRKVKNHPLFFINKLPNSENR